MTRSKALPGCRQGCNGLAGTHAAWFAHVSRLHLPASNWLPGMHLRRFEADEIYTVRRIVHPVLQAEWDLRCGGIADSVLTAAHACAPQTRSPPLSPSGYSHMHITQRCGVTDSSDQTSGPFLPCTCALTPGCMVARGCRYLEHQRKEQEAEAQLMKNVSL